VEKEGNYQFLYAEKNMRGYEGGCTYGTNAVATRFESDHSTLFINSIKIRKINVAKIFQQTLETTSSSGRAISR